MLAYSIIIFAGVLLSVLINIIKFAPQNTPYGDLALWILISILICGLSSGLICIITRLLPKSVFNPHRRRFRTFSVEANIYKRLGVKGWKAFVPDLGKLSGLEKNKITQPNNPEYLEKFLIENCIAECLHFWSFISGSLIFFFLPGKYAISIGLIIFYTNAILHILPIFIQRYVRPKMLKIYDRLVEKQRNSAEIFASDDQENVGYKKA